MKYTYNSPIGLLEITQHHRHWQLIIAGEPVGNYSTPQLAADDVAVQVTGHITWDTHPDPSPPRDLTEWHLSR